MKTISLKAIERIKDRRPPGYEDEIKRIGQLVDGHVILSDEDYQDIRDRFPEVTQSGSPTIRQKVVNAAGATVRIAKSGFELAPSQSRERNKAICEMCKEWNPKGNLGLGECKKCGCTKLKTAFSSERCPVGNWSKYVLMYHCDGKTGLGQLGHAVAYRLLSRNKLAFIQHTSAGFERAFTPQELWPKISAFRTNQCDLVITGLQHTYCQESPLFWTMYESSLIPKDNVDLCNRHEAIIVPSDWNRRAFIESGVTVPIHVVPLGTSVAEYPRRHFRPGPFTFMTGGRILHGHTRKGVEDVLRAFERAFPGERDVRLLIKITPDDPLPQINDDRVQVIRTYQSQQQMLDYYESCHVFVTASRGEGWGLMPHQAMTVGRPVIAPIWGGFTEWLDSEVAFPVEFEEMDADGPYKGHGKWAVPFMDSLVSQMRFCFDHPEKVAEKGILAHDRALHYSWDLTVNTLEPLLLKYCGGTKKKRSTSRPIFYHAGDIGDALFGCSVIKSLGGGELVLGNKVSLPPGLSPRDGISEEIFKLMLPLLEAQPYIDNVTYSPIVPWCDFDLNKFRLHWKGILEPYEKRMVKYQVRHSPNTLQLMARAAVGLWDIDETQPWIQVPEPLKITGKEIICHRSPRARNDLFPWGKAVKKYGDKMLFVGLHSEHSDFIQRFGFVDFYAVSDFLEMAKLISGATLYIGNGSAPYTIAEGLKQNCIQETRVADPSDNIFLRDNAYYCWDGEIEFPELDKLDEFFRTNRHRSRMYQWIKS